jgi:hypothetical protein
MKDIFKYVIGAALGIALVAGASVAFAQSSFQDGPRFGNAEGPAFFQQAGEEGAPCGGRGGPGAGGEVTAVSDSSLTVATPKGDSVTVKVSEDTVVRLVESQSEGSLSDIEVGDNVMVRGQRNDDGSVEAKAIMVAPDGDMAGGRVTAVDGSTITTENRAGDTATILTSDSTEFRLGRTGETGSIADVTTDSGVRAFGDLQEDGSLQARLVFIGPGGPGHEGGKGPRPGNGPAGQ